MEKTRWAEGLLSSCLFIWGVYLYVWDGITWGTWGRDVLRSVGFYIKCTQSRSATTLKSNILNSLIMHILIFILISPREPKETFGDLMIATGHCLLHVVQILSRWALSWVWRLAQMHIHSHISASNILLLPESMHKTFSLLFYFHRPVSGLKSLKQDTEAPEDSSGHLHIFKLVDLFKLNTSWWPCRRLWRRRGPAGAGRQTTTSWKNTKKWCLWCALWYS